MVKRLQKALQTPATRQQTLIRDRMRTRAVSQYLAHHRESLLDMVPSNIRKDRNLKRKELERLARQEFNKKLPRASSKSIMPKLQHVRRHREAMRKILVQRSSRVLVHWWSSGVLATARPLHLP